VPGQGTDLSVTLPTTAAANQALFVPEQVRRQLQEAQ
jgi:chemotaxis protein histidine kinase CheA